VIADVETERRRLVDWYTAFATDEAQGRFPIYERLAAFVAASPELLDFLPTLPVSRRQPNLFLAAVRHLHGVPECGACLADVVRADADGIRAAMLTRTTQTNEPARCAVLLPVLAQLPQPLALIEVGASAGLCLLPDRYGYDYGTARIEPPTASAPVLRCRISGSAPLPKTLPQIVWRRGLDLHPIDLRYEAETAWLKMLIWPGQDDRARNLRAAIAVARDDPPTVIKGNLLTDLAPLMAEAPPDATLVVFHTAVLPYVARDDRNRFVQMIRQSRAIWISNEAPGLFPRLAAAPPPAPEPGLFLLARDDVALAWSGPHGQSMHWFGPSD
jgi:hypothetical protein